MERILLLLCFVVFYIQSEAAPWSTTPKQQACGDQLANAMSLVCNGRYNVPFRPERSTNNARRIRRQIADECCHNSCNPTLLELYCKAETAETAETAEAPANVQIRKRSDNGAVSSEMRFDIAMLSKEQSQTSTEKMSHTQTPTGIEKRGKPNEYKNLNRLTSSKIGKINKKTKQSMNKTMEDDIFNQNSFPQVRHHKNYDHSRQQHHGKLRDTQTKRERSTSEEKQTFQIGTVKPYFAGRAIVAYRGNYIHQRHAPTQEP